MNYFGFILIIFRLENCVIVSAEYFYHFKVISYRIRANRGSLFRCKLAVRRTLGRANRGGENNLLLDPPGEEGQRVRL
jgi:hypothetical protein